jgi:hypothetical protein
MASSSWALQQAVFAAVTTHPAVTALLGTPRLYDDVPQSPAYPYLTLGQSTVRDWSAGGDGGDEHTLTLHVWSRAGGRREAHEIMGALKIALHDAALTLSGHRLVNLRHELSEARRESDGDTYHGIVRFRAVTEPLP